jgi:hypothetical protein
LYNVENKSQTYIDEKKIKCSWQNEGVRMRENLKINFNFFVVSHAWRWNHHNESISFLRLVHIHKSVYYEHIIVKTQKSSPLIFFLIYAKQKKCIIKFQRKARLLAFVQPTTWRLVLHWKVFFVKSERDEQHNE